MSFLKKFKNMRKGSESGSLGSTLSLKAASIPYSVVEKDLNPFLKSIWKNDLIKMRKLMKKNLNLADKEGRTGLHVACALGAEDVVRELLESGGVELLERRDCAGRTSVFKAAEAESVACVRLLLGRGARTDCVDELGDSLLHVAVRHKQDNCVDCLLEGGCEHSLINKEGLSPLHVAATINYVFGINLLLEYGVNVDMLTSTGKSALILAAESGNYNSIKLLLSKNADYKILDNDGKDAQYYADFHEYNDCSQQLQSQNNYSENKTPPKRPSPIQMPEFIVSLGSDYNEVQEVHKSPIKSLLRNQDSKVNEEVKEKKDIAKKKQVKAEDGISMMSENSWSGDISHYSSDTTLPINKINPMNDVSTPSSMPNPSEDNSFNPLKSLTHGVSKSQLHKHISDDEESQWTDTEEVNELNFDNEIVIKPEQKIKTENKSNVVEAVKNSNSDWDSDTDMGKYVAEDLLSTIDEESGVKQELNVPLSKDGDQTDSNIEECFTTNCLILNKPVRYDSSETLDNSFEYYEEETELSQTKIRNPNYAETSLTIVSKPPISSMYKDENLPIIRVEDSDKMIKWAQSASGDNLSYTSTEHSSRAESLVGSEQLSELDKSNPKLMGEYIKKCSSMESKLRKIESEKDMLEQKIKLVEDSKRKMETEKLKLQKDNQKLEVMCSEQKDELDEVKSRFIISEELLKTREKELFESKKMNQELIANRNEIEMKNIAFSSKINQLTQEVTNLHSELQKKNNSGTLEDNYSVHETFLEKSMEHLKNKVMTSDKDVESLKSQFDNERMILQKEKNDLTIQLEDIKKDLDELKKVSESKIMEQKYTIEQKEERIKELTYTVEDTKEEYLNKDEEIEQLKKTIKNLNADLESSNKFATMAAKEEQKHKILNEQLKVEENKVEKMGKEIQALKDRVSETDQNNKNISHEMEKIKNQLILKDESCTKLELKSKTFEKQCKDFEQLLENKAQEVKQINKKCSELDESLMSEKNKYENIMEELNGIINSAFKQSPDSEEVLDHLESLRNLISGYKGSHDHKVFKTSPSYQDLDSTIELTKAKSQIKVLQDQLANVRRDLKQSESIIEPRISGFEEKEMNRIDRIEKIEKENQQYLNEQTKTLRNSQHQVEQENKHLRKSLLQEKQRIQQSQDKEKSLSLQLSNAIKRNQVMEEGQETLKQMLIKYYKLLESEDKVMSSFTGNTHIAMNTDNIDVMMFCSKLLQKLTEINEEMKGKLKKVETEKMQLEEEQLTRDKNKDIVLGNSKMILTQQLSELTQMMDNQRNNREKLEKIRDENEFQLRNELYEIKQSSLMEINNLNQTVSRLEKDREELIQEVRELGDQLIKERNLKDSLTEQLVNVIKNPNGSVSQINGGKEFIFPNPTTVNGSSQWNVLYNNEVDRKQFSTSMSNLSMLRANGIEDEEMRQRMRAELDRSIAKHLESGKPIRYLNVKDKIRSLNMVKFPSSNVVWKSLV